MFPGCRGRTLANMSQTDWSDLGMTDLLPTGMVTLLLADVEGSTRLWESQSKEMAAAVARLDDVLTEVVARHQGVRPVEQGEGDSFVLAFARASDAVACALELQLAPLAPLRLRSVCTPARSSCGTRPTTWARPSIARRAYGIWRTAARRCCPA